MSSAPIGSSPALPPYLNTRQESDARGLPAGQARKAPTSPGHRMPVIDRGNVDPQVRAAGEGMEAMFIDYMMKVMRETVPKSDMDLESPATQVYRGMLDAENSQRAAKAGGIGIADQIIAYLDSQKYTLRNTTGGASASRVNDSGSNEASASAAKGETGAPAANGIGGTTHEN